MNFYKHFIGDYQRDTMRLSMLEDGAYRRLLDEYYATEEPLPLEPEECYRAARAVTKAEQTAVDKILARYFTRKEDGYHHTRADEEIAAAHEYVDAQRKRAHMRWHKQGHMPPHERGLSRGMDSGNATGNASHSHSHKNQKNMVARATRFDDWWKAYPKKRKRKNALEIWKRKHLDDRADELIADVQRRLVSDQRWLSGFVPDPTTYLNGERWEDEVTPGNGAGKDKPETDHEIAVRLQKQHGLNPYQGYPHETSEQFIARVRDAVGSAAFR